MFRTLGTRLRTSSSARFALYGTAAAGTSLVVWRYNAYNKAHHARTEVSNNTHQPSSKSQKHEKLEPTKPTKSSLQESDKTTKESQPSEKTTPPAPTSVETPEEGTDMGELEGEAANTGAFDPVTGEINWDCPCLGGMAHGPCGPEFKEAFACFVYSEEDPKGIDCVEKFRAMQDCFRAHPEIYAEELAGDEDDEELNDLTPSDSDSPSPSPKFDPPSSDSSKPPETSSTPPPPPTPSSGGEGLEPPSKPKPIPSSPPSQGTGRRLPPAGRPRPGGSPRPPQGSGGDDDLKIPGEDEQIKLPGSPPPLPVPGQRGPTIIDPPAPGVVGAGGITGTNTSTSRS